MKQLLIITLLPLFFCHGCRPGECLSYPIPESAEKLFFFYSVGSLWIMEDSEKKTDTVVCTAIDSEWTEKKACQDDVSKWAKFRFKSSTLCINVQTDLAKNPGDSYYFNQEPFPLTENNITINDTVYPSITLNNNYYWSDKVGFIKIIIGNRVFVLKEFIKK